MDTSAEKVEKSVEFSCHFINKETLHTVTPGWDSDLDGDVYFSPCAGGFNEELPVKDQFNSMVTDGNVYRTTLEDLPSPHLSEWVLEVGSTGGVSLIFPGQSSRFHNIIQCFFQITAFVNIH